MKFENGEKSGSSLLLLYFELELAEITVGICAK